MGERRQPPSAGYSLRNRLLLGALGMLIPAVLTGGLALVFLGRALGRFDQAVEESVHEIYPAVRVQTLLFQVASAARDWVSTASPAARQALARLVAATDREFQELERLPFREPSERDLVVLARRRWLAIRPRLDELVTLPAPPNQATHPAARQLDEALQQLAQELLATQLVANEELQTSLHAVRALYRRMALILSGILVAGLAGVAALAVWLGRCVILPLQRLEEGARRLGEGELSYRLPSFCARELASVAATFNAMAERLAQDRAALEELATHDPLTGLYNHRAFQQRLQEELERARRYRHPMALLMADVGTLKAVNDLFGHPAGDSLLRAVAQTMRHHIRAPDIAARYGGDEFALILPETTLSQALTVAQRIQAAVARLRIPGLPPQSASVSVGIAAYPADGDTPWELLSAADQALYRAKRAGRNRVELASGVPQPVGVCET